MPTLPNDLSLHFQRPQDKTIHSDSTLCLRVTMRIPPRLERDLPLKKKRLVLDLVKNGEARTESIANSPLRSVRSLDSSKMKK